MQSCLGALRLLSFVIVISREFNVKFGNISKVSSTAELVLYRSLILNGKREEKGLKGPLPRLKVSGLLRRQSFRFVSTWAASA